ncbi:MAG: EscU/YscU/HrcU family type III secretion system export apparatus switch protein, partial [Pseudomonadota bacterium]
MADDQDKDSKSEDPTEKKISETLEKGNVPVSKEITNVLSVLGITLVIAFYAPQFSYEIAKTMKSVFANTGDWSFETGEDVMDLAGYLGASIGLLMLPVLIPMILFGVGSSIIQNRPRFVPDRIVPKAN